MDKLLCVRFDENSNDRHRRSFAYETADNTLEELESAVKTPMGVTKTRYREKHGEADSVLGRPISICGDKVLPGQGCYKRKTDQCRIGQLSGLLYQTS